MSDDVLREIDHLRRAPSQPSAGAAGGEPEVPEGSVRGFLREGRWQPVGSREWHVEGKLEDRPLALRVSIPARKGVLEVVEVQEAEGPSEGPHLRFEEALG